MTLTERVARAMVLADGPNLPELVRNKYAAAYAVMADAAIRAVLARLLELDRTVPLLGERLEQGGMPAALELFAILEDLPWPPTGEGA